MASICIHARRGNLLPKGYQNLSKIEAVSKPSKIVEDIESDNTPAEK
ncbi:Topoisomerase IV subunit A [uncultured Candidatus Thioglobus sp.]|nr:Topoisomerase IV subunit A [uncultured Candidatus Thioglobus sp.]